MDVFAARKVEELRNELLPHYGYPDEEYLKLKIVAAFLPPLPRNAVFNPHESA